MPIKISNHEIYYFYKINNIKALINKMGAECTVCSECKKEETEVNSVNNLNLLI